MNWTARRPKDSSLDVSRTSEIFTQKPQNIDESLEKFSVQLKTTW